MKKLLFLIAFVSCAAGVYAQRAESHSSSFFSVQRAERPITIGLRAGVNFSGLSESVKNGSLDGEEFPKGRTGFNVGVSVDFPILESFYVQSGLYFTTKGASYTESDYKDYVTPMYLELPVYASYRLNFSQKTQLQINVGPYFAMGVAGKYKWEETEDGETYKNSEPIFGKHGDIDYPIKRGDVGLGVGAGVTFGKVYVGFIYSFGFVNVLRDDYYIMRNSNFSINLGYNF